MRRISVILALLLCGCAHKAVKHVAPDMAPLRQKQSEQQVHVKKAQDEVKRARISFAAAKVEHSKTLDAHAQERAAIEQFGPVLDDLRKTATPEQQAQIDGIAAKYQAAYEATDAHMSAESILTGEGEQHLSGAEDSAGKAIASGEAIATQYGPEYEAKVETQTAELNKLDAAYAKDSAALLWYRMHWLIGWIVMGLGIVACGVFAFLKFTGRLAVAGASVAAKL